MWYLLFGDSWNYLIGSKPVFVDFFGKFFPPDTQNIILCKIRFNPREISLNQTLENSILYFVFGVGTSHQSEILHSFIFPLEKRRGGGWRGLELWNLFA